MEEIDGGMKAKGEIGDSEVIGDSGANGEVGDTRGEGILAAPGAADRVEKALAVTGAPGDG